jgi:hypothetical protein
VGEVVIFTGSREDYERMLNGHLESVEYSIEQVRVRGNNRLRRAHLRYMQKQTALALEALDNIEKADE